jgi:hypothetical protein
MAKLLATGKTDLLQFVSARTRRPFSAYLVKQADGKVGFEFEAKEPGRKGTRPIRGAPLRVLGTHPRDRQPVELHSGRYGPYVKHGSVNATLPNRDAVDTLSLDEAVALVDEKAGRETRPPRRSVGTRAPRKTPLAAAEPAIARTSSSAKTSASAARKAPALRKTTKTARPPASKTAVGKAKPAPRTTTSKSAKTAVAAKRKTRATPALKAPVAAIARKSAARDAAKKTKRR